MLSHLHRFHGHGSLRFLYRHGRVIRSRNLSVRYIKNPHRVHSRFAVVVSKKVFKSAVKRNRLRRRIFEIVRTKASDLNTGHDVLITIFSPELLVMSTSELTNEVTGLLAKEQLLG